MHPCDAPVTLAMKIELANVTLHPDLLSNYRRGRYSTTADNGTVIHLRMSRMELHKIERASRRIGLRRNQFIREVARAVALQIINGEYEDDYREDAK